MGHGGEVVAIEALMDQKVAERMQACKALADHEATFSSVSCSKGLLVVFVGSARLTRELFTLGGDGGASQLFKIGLE